MGLCESSVATAVVGSSVAYIDGAFTSKDLKLEEEADTTVQSLCASSKSFEQAEVWTRPVDGSSTGAEGSSGACHTLMILKSGFACFIVEKFKQGIRVKGSLHV